MDTSTPITVDFTTGNFDLAITATIKQEVLAKIIKSGFAYIVQRDGATSAYLEIAGVKNEKGNLSLPDGFVRKSVEYSDDNGQIVADAFQTALRPYTDSVTVKATEHVEAETVGSRKQATEMWMKAQANPALLAALGSPSGDEAGIEACHSFLSSLRKPKS